MQAVSGFDYPCIAFCNDQTALQRNYNNARDQCQEYASLSLETDTTSVMPPNDKERKSKLVALFADCMAEKGWTVPGGKDPNAKPVPPAPAPSPPPPIIVSAPAVDEAAEKRRAKKMLSRAAECAYARHAASYTSVSAERAKACDLECSKGRREGKNPSACPSEPDPPQ